MSLNHDSSRRTFPGTTAAALGLASTGLYAKRQSAVRGRITTPYRIGPKLIAWFTIVIVVISSAGAYLNLRSQTERLLETMLLGADQLSRSITSATWHTTIQVLNSASGMTNALGVPSAFFSVSLDDKYVVWQQYEQFTQDLMLVEGFR